jgi:hypothetical protein
MNRQSIGAKRRKTRPLVFTLMQIETIDGYSPKLLGFSTLTPVRLCFAKYLT